MVKHYESSGDSSGGEDNDFASSLIPDYNSDSDIEKSGKPDKKKKKGKKNFKAPKTAQDLELLGEESGDEDAIKQINSKKKKTASGGFQSMGLSPFLLKAIQRKGFKIPTPIQRKMYSPCRRWV
ncbi:ATP-dependent RNA helicase dbp10 [Entomophthora muscae]|uniref:ATP-dependent RNA helicase dbp10 n=1 Tax=Entomophthora muscae TaxID=34485 RepID=A0ACC2UJD7_9FUNG|nr:ATP-dependent RNA helicase dbp10 [Entomophthora muscae]